MFTILACAALPFGLKAVVIALGARGYLAQSLYKIAQLTGPVLWRMREGKNGWAILWPVDEPRPSVAVWGIATAIAVGLSGSFIIASQWLAPRFGLDPAVIRAGLDARFAVTPGIAVAIVLFLSFANSALEELHFRAWLDRELSRRLGDVLGVVLSATAFGAMHILIFWGLPGFSPFLLALVAVGVGLCGACWSILRRFPGGIHAAWWSHGLTDALLLGWGLWWLGYAAGQE